MADADVLLTQIREDALGGKPLADALRKVVALGAETGSTQLRQWAGLELRGYKDSGVELPSYRKPSAVILIDGVVNVPGGIMKNTGRQISPRSLPDFARDKLDEYVPLLNPVAEIESMLRQAETNGGINLSLPHSQDLVRVMNQEVGDPFQRITSMYWSLAAPAIAGALDQIRTALVELVAEVRIEMPLDTTEPTGETVDRAFNIAIYGSNPHVNVTTATASGSGSHTVSADTSVENVHHVEALWPALRTELADLGLPAEELEELHGALVSDADCRDELGPATSSWLGRLSGKLATGALAVSSAASSEAISHAVLKSLGLA